MKILVVDDEKTLLDQLERALEDQRYMVETALDGQEALDNRCGFDDNDNQRGPGRHPS